MAASAGHETRALLRAHLSAASSYRHLTRHCPICHRLLRLAESDLREEDRESQEPREACAFEGRESRAVPADRPDRQADGHPEAGRSRQTHRTEPPREAGDAHAPQQHPRTPERPADPQLDHRQPGVPPETRPNPQAEPPRDGRPQLQAEPPHAAAPQPSPAELPYGATHPRRTEPPRAAAPQPSPAALPHGTPASRRPERPHGAPQPRQAEQANEPQQPRRAELLHGPSQSPPAEPPRAAPPQSRQDESPRAAPPQHRQAEPPPEDPPQRPPAGQS
ncbi:DUF6274 family protein [Streptomyces sp. NPDC102395]|uniref:DUF6274 family protein n=1 Tax=Streptomyces sp. NPDC102395 TaxID=3366168 RepID=UPI0038229765